MKRLFPLPSLCVVAAAVLVTPMLPAAPVAAEADVRWSITVGGGRDYHSSRYDRYDQFDRFDRYDRYDRYRSDGYRGHHRHHRYCGCDRSSYRRVTYRPVFVHYDRPRYRSDYRQHRWSSPGLRFSNERYGSYDRYDRGRRGWGCD